MQKNNFDIADSVPEGPSVCIDETSSDWEFSGITFFRALGYVVGLLSFMVGTALFMLGFSISNLTCVQFASGLYSLSIIALTGRIVIQKFRPRNEIQALVVGLTMLCVGGLIYACLFILITVTNLI